ncbi:MAG: tetratricopeptide repeat protein [Leptolyngbyaceae cyanobacterium SL_1_1]|nr:tetratricopeptide repeat protein [Leptolyngbyaceae cyanobacterium RM1_1_2]NJO11218.1 tetratricopeptide repeat protein [Leptolyngbyaceae cyanobacterium SL_1_1]
MDSADYQQGLEKLHAGDRTGAIQAFNRALRVQPDWAEAYTQRAKAKFGNGDHSGAIADYTQALQRQPTSEAHLGRGLARVATGDTQGAIADAEQALTLSELLPAAHNLLGLIYRKVGNLSAAIAAYKQAAQGYIQQKDKASAERCVQTLGQLQARPLALPALIDVKTYLHQVSQKIDQQNYSSALADLNWLLQSDPQDAQAYCLRGIVRAKLSNAQGALQDLAAAMRLAPQDRNIQYQRALVRLALGDARGALADLKQLLERSPQQVELYVQCGSAYQQLKDYRQAIQYYGQALQLKADSAQIYWQRAEVREAFEDISSAVEDYQQAANLWFNQGNWPRYQQALAQVQRLQTRLPSERATLEKAAGLEELQSQLAQLVGGTWEIAERLLAIARQRYPDKSEVWYLRQVIGELERDR